MLHRIMAAGFENVIEANHIAFNVGIRVGDGVANTCLCTEIDHDIWMILLKDAVDKGFVCKIALNEGIVLKFLKFSKTSLFDADIIVLVHVVQPDDFCVRFSGQDTLGQVGTNETGGAGDKYFFLITSKTSFLRKLPLSNRVNLRLYL